MEAVRWQHEVRTNPMIGIFHYGERGRGWLLQAKHGDRFLGLPVVVMVMVLVFEGRS